MVGGATRLGFQHPGQPPERRSLVRCAQDQTPPVSGSGGPRQGGESSGMCSITWLKKMTSKGRRPRDSRRCLRRPARPPPALRVAARRCSRSRRAGDVRGSHSRCAPSPQPRSSPTRCRVARRRRARGRSHVGAALADVVAVRPGRTAPPAGLSYQAARSTPLRRRSGRRSRRVAYSTGMPSERAIAWPCSQKSPASADRQTGQRNGSAVAVGAVTCVGLIRLVEDS